MFNNLEWQKQYNKDNKDKIKKYRENNKDKQKQYSKKYYSQNKDKFKEYCKKNKNKLIEYRKKNKDKRRQYELNKRYGITLEQYNEMLVKQDSKCLGCGIHQSELKTRLAVDHDHKTGKIRGLLCANNCNVALGLLKDSPQILDNLASYLRNNQV